MKLSGFFVCLIVLVGNNGYGQDGWTNANFTFSVAKTDFKGKRVIPPSPEAADLGKYGNVPVSLFSGTPKISIPIYDIKGNSVDVPISLSYNSNGFKPEDIATWVGLGWSLNAGGVVTRSVMGNPDNANNYFTANNTYASLPPVNDWLANYNYIDSVRSGYKETQPDEYYFNFPGHSGKFFLAPDLSVVKKEKDNLKIVPNGVQNDATGISNFTIIDEQGNTYLFSNTEISRMQIDDGSNPGIPQVMNYVYPSSWFLTSITSPDNQEVIQFNYYTAPSDHTQYTNYVQNSSFTYSHNTANNTSSTFETFVGINVQTVPTVTITGRRYLSSITFTKGLSSVVTTVNFDAGTNLRQDLDHTQYPGEQLLQAIRISSSIGLVKKFNLYYGYFTNSTQTDYSHKRLRLDSVSEVPNDNSGLYKPPYFFIYNNGNVPSTAQPGIDHWGYFNGGDLVSTYVPNYMPTGNGIGAGSYFGGGANRNPDSTSGALTLLTQLHYPTGGYTSFIYEPNWAKDNYSGNFVMVGGLRIKKIIDYSFANKQATTKYYQYTLSDGTTSSGFTAVPQYFSYNNYHSYPYPILHGGTSPETFTTNLNISSSSVYGLGTFQGSHIGYSQVTEYQVDSATNISLGRSVYYYNLGQYSSDDDDIGSGDLIEQKAYDNNGKVLQDMVNTYTYGQNPIGAVYYKVNTYGGQDNKSVLCQYTVSGSTVYSWKGSWESGPTCTLSRTYLTKYYLSGTVRQSQYKQLASETQTIYDQKSNAFTVLTKKFTYGNPAYTYPTLIENYSTGNEELVTSKKYAADYVIPGSGTLDNTTTAIKLLQIKNMLGTEIESLQYRQNIDGTNKRYVSGSINSYYPFTPYAQSSNMPYLKSIYRLELSTPVTSIQSSTISSGNFTYDPSYKIVGSFNYDPYGNISEQSKDQDIVKSYIWDYGNLLPVAEIINSNAINSAYSSFEPGTTGGNWLGISSSYYISGGYCGKNAYAFNSTSTPLGVNSLPTNRQYIVSYWSKSGAVNVYSNIGSASPVSGNSYNGWTYYEHLLPAGSNQVRVASTTAIIDELRLFPKDAQMSSYSYNPLIGITGQSNPTNQYSFYEYDGFSRLINVRDQAGNIVKNFKYNYGLGAALTPSAQSLFYNAPAQGTYTYNLTCPSGALPNSIVYSVPYGKYVSSISQADANAKASNDLAANGQAYANANAGCLWWNVQQVGYFGNSNCNTGGYSCPLNLPHFHGNLTYTIPAHTYSSAISQADADNQAITALNAQGQAYGNANCTCLCGAEGQKVVNGTCETGTRFNSSTTLMANGSWQCIYYYSFSDGSVSQFYTSYSTSPCPIQ